MVKRKIIVVLAIVMFPAMSCDAAWMRQEGELSGYTGFALNDNGGFYDRNTTKIRRACNPSMDIPLQAEYGYSYYRTVYLNTSLTSSGCGKGHVTGFTDIELGTRGRLNLARSDHTWELGAILPNTPGPRPKYFGIKFGINSSDRIDAYQAFLANDMYSKGEPNVFSYGAGFNLWKGHVPNEASAYIGWGHTLANPTWQNDTGGWYFSARLDGSRSVRKVHSTTVPLNAPLVRDSHDRFALIAANIGIAHSLTKLSSIQLSLKQGIWGRNVSNPSGIHLGYSRVWRD